MGASDSKLEHYSSKVGTILANSVGARCSVDPAWAVTALLPHCAGCQMHDTIELEEVDARKAGTCSGGLFSTQSLFGATSSAAECFTASHPLDEPMELKVHEGPEGDKELKDAMLAHEDLNAAFAFLSIGMKRQKLGKMSGALNCLREALQVRSFMKQYGGNPNELRSPELHSALFLIKEAIDISECTGTQSTASGAILTGIYGILCHLRGDLDHATEAYQQALNILERLGEEYFLQRAIFLGCLGDVRSELENHKAALISYMEAHQVRLVKRMLQTYQGALLMTSIGLTRLDLGDAIGALEAYTLAVLVFDSLSGTKTNTFAVLLTYIGLAKLRAGDMEDAMTSFKQARSIRQGLGTLSSPAGRHLTVILSSTKRKMRQHGTETIVHSHSSFSEGGQYKKQADMYF